MALLGQATGAWTESSSALRILYVGIRNSLGILTADSFTQTNPPIAALAVPVSTKLDTTAIGVLSGSVAFTRPDSGSNYIGGPTEPAVALAVGVKEAVTPLGLFINSAAGNSYENLPAAASGKGPYVSGQGTYATALYETDELTADPAGWDAIGDPITWQIGQKLAASRNGYLMPTFCVNNAVAWATCLHANTSAEMKAGIAIADVVRIGVVKMVADSGQDEIVYDQWI